MGRWSSEDPKRFQAGDVNLDRYVGNNPTNATDPTGLQDPRIIPPTLLPTDVLPPKMIPIVLGDVWNALFGECIPTRPSVSINREPGGGGTAVHINELENIPGKRLKTEVEVFEHPFLKYNRIDLNSIRYGGLRCNVTEGSSVVFITAPPGTYNVTIRVSGKLEQKGKSSTPDIVQLEVENAQNVVKAGQSTYFPTTVKNYSISRKTPVFDDMYTVTVDVPPNKSTQPVLIVQPYAYVAKGSVKLTWWTEYVSLKKVK